MLQTETPSRHAGSSSSKADNNSLNTMWLEVRRGKTNSPRRPVRSNRFLIGAGSNCQLQLGGDEIPILHSVLLVEEQGAHIDSLVEHPTLLVNGAPRRTADLQNGDIFTIGRFEFAVHVPQPTESDSLENLQADVEADADPEADLDEVGKLTAAELVERIEQEQSLVNEYQDARYAGARALLQAASLKTAALREASGDMSPERLLAELRQLSVELDRRAVQLAQREAACEERAAHLLRMHDRMAASVETLATRVDAHEVDPAFQRQAS